MSYVFLNGVQHDIFVRRRFSYLTAFEKQLQKQIACREWPRLKLTSFNPDKNALICKHQYQKSYW